MKTNAELGFWHDWRADCPSSAVLDGHSFQGGEAVERFKPFFTAMTTGFDAAKGQLYTATGSNFAVGVLGIVQLVPLLVFGLYGGALADPRVTVLAEDVRAIIRRALHDRIALLHRAAEAVCRASDDGATAAPELETIIANICAASGHSHVVNGRFKGGWTTRHYGRPDDGIHAIQMELAQRGYMAEPATITEASWPSPIDPDPAILPTLRQIIAATLDFAKGQK